MGNCLWTVVVGLAGTGPRPDNGLRRSHTMGKALAAQIAGLQQGDHVCCYYDSAADQSEVVVAYIEQGLKRSERCLYIADDRSVAEVAGFLGGAGIDVRKQLSRGALVLISSKEAHLKSGRFDCEAMLALLNDAVEQALNDGFNGLRAAGEMTWILTGAPGSNEALEYEALMNEFYPKSRALGVMSLQPLSLRTGNSG